VIYDIPHVTRFSEQWSALKIQWEVVHLPPQCRDGNGGSVYLSLDWLEYIRAMNTPEAFKWMIGDSGTIIWGIKDKRNLGAKVNKARMPVIAIGGNQIKVNDLPGVKGFRRVVGLSEIDFSISPDEFPWFWHRIWCVTKCRGGICSAPHDTPRGPAFMPILNVGAFKRTKALAAGVTYIKIVEDKEHYV